MELTTEEIARVFAMYMPCGTIQGGNNFNRQLVAVGGFSDNGFTYGKLKNKASVASCLIKDFKIILTPLSKITDEHAIEVAELEGSDSNFRYRPNLKHLIKYVREERIEEWVERSFKIYSYAISKGYDVPLWFGIGHWANGKTAIEVGIAISN